MKSTNLCFLLRSDEVLLAMKKRGFGVGKWNGIGGKVASGETVKEAAVREIKEEIGVTVQDSDLEDFGTLRFSFKDNPDWNNEMKIFVVRKWMGEPVESEEMRPKWHPKGALPFDAMWVDDPLWLPEVLAGKRVEGAFLFTGDGRTIISFEVKKMA